jgi:hypothetical protein
MRTRLFALPALSSVLSIILVGALCGQEGPEVPVPHGPAITLDGTLGAEEWEGGARFAMTGGGEVRLRARGSELLLGVRGAGPGFPHVALSAGDSVWILHASAALGTITYARDDGNRWRPVRGPVWEMRDTTLSDAAGDAREAYLGEHGWVASTARMGREGDAEFVIHLDRFGGGDVRLGVASLVLPRRPVAPRWPDAVPDDMNKGELLGGDTPDSLSFRPSGWARLLFPELEKAPVINPENASRLEKIAAFDLPASFVNAFVFSPDSRYLFSGDRNREVIRWERGPWTRHTLQEAQGSYQSDEEAQLHFYGTLALSPDGEALVTTDLDGGIRVRGVGR